MENQELIVIEQLPIIKEELKKVALEIDHTVDYAKNLICTEDNKQSIKKTRADLKKEFEQFEMQRKAVKEKILAPYMQFEEVYKVCISDKYKSADKDLKEKIDAIEVEQKQRLENGAREFFDEYKLEKNIDFIKFEQIGIKIGLSDNLTKLKKQIIAFIDKIQEDLQLIDIQEHKAEILVEYKQTLNVSNAITTVANRFKAIEEEKKKQEEKIEIIEEPKENEEFKVAAETFKVIPEKKKIILEITAEDTEIQEVINYLKLKNINFESRDM